MTRAKIQALINGEWVDVPGSHWNDEIFFHQSGVVSWFARLADQALDDGNEELNDHWSEAEIMAWERYEGFI